MGRVYDALVAGGSIAGLAFAAEAAGRGVSVLVAEEHGELGEPEKCDGLVSLRGLRRYGFAPDDEVIQCGVSRGIVRAPSGGALSVDASGLEVAVLDRSAFDGQVGRMAASRGAELRLGARVSAVRTSQDGTMAKVGGETVEARYFVDATGPSSGHRRGIIPAAKYEIEADWVEEGVVEVFLDARLYPGFFAWVIPFGPGLAKVGAAGRGVDPSKALAGFLSERPHRVLRKVSAPIYVGGPVDGFASGRSLKVGESAGQVKPTTAGGITTSVAGAAMAALWVSEALKSGDPSFIGNYARDWDKAYGKEMRAMARLRGVFEKLSNSDLDSAMEAVSHSRLASKLSKTDFDLHGTAVLAALGLKGLLRVAAVVASAEARSLLSAPGPD